MTVHRSVRTHGPSSGGSVSSADSISADWCVNSSLKAMMCVNALVISLIRSSKLSLELALGVGEAPGMEAALGGRQGRRPSYVRKADGEFEARLVALSCTEPPEGHSQWSLRLLADRVVEFGHIDSVSHETVRRVLKKTQSSRGGASAG